MTLIARPKQQESEQDADRGQAGTVAGWGRAAGQDGARQGWAGAEGR